ncbi:MAG: PAS domain-containing sensor histidine kinase [Oligoflexales bacterium]|nr:PAS domain-containing sensor histidine kinase [Oligoflexales bacterium]
MLTHELLERTKELNCMYEVAKIVASSMPLNEILKQIAQIVPSGWQHSESASCRIVLDGDSYSSSLEGTSKRSQRSDIIVTGELRGFIEVCYLEKFPTMFEGPFLKEERDLLNAIARTLSITVKSKTDEEQKNNLQTQLLHADRLATIGQLVTGIAHEINEPMANILGYTQLIKKNDGLSKQIYEDLLKIEQASLYIKEIIKKLMVFTRTATSEFEPVNLNTIIEESLFLFEKRCEKENIVLKISLSANRPYLMANPSQIKQVIINIAINGIQAMENGGVLSIDTEVKNKKAILTIEDTGIGIPKSIQKKIFLPFFTTKDVSEGTGLGLSVVYGIVTTHKGEIEVMSDVGKGSKFRILFPLEKAY